MYTGYNPGLASSPGLASRPGLASNPDFNLFKIIVYNIKHAHQHIIYFK